MGGLLEKVTLGAVTSWKHRISAANGVVAIYTRKSTGANEMHYLTKDHLGSVDTITSAAGAVEARLSFSSAGQRRNEAGWSGPPTSSDWSGITNTTRRGFTGHEHLDNLNLIHMNGRVYDPAAGRFLSPDPFIDGTLNTQGWNRYAYVHNNPLSYSDPSGYWIRYLLIHPREWRPPDVIVEGRRSQGLSLARQDMQRVLDQLDSIRRQETDPPGDEVETIEEVLVTGRRVKAPQWPAHGGSPGSSGVGEEVTVTATKQQCTQSSADGDFGSDLAGAVVGFGDAFLLPILVRDLFDIGGNIDYSSSAYSGGMITGTVWGSATIALRGTAAVGGTRFGHALNHNRYVRVGPGRMRANGSLPSGNAVPRVSIGPQRPGVSNPHIDLRTRVPPVPPLGALAGGDENDCTN